MARTLYSFTKVAAVDRLEKEIHDCAIVIALDSITLDSTDQLSVWFRDALSGGDETILNALVVAHSGVPLESNFRQLVQPTVVYNEHLLVPKGMRKIRFQADTKCAAITLSNRVGDTFDYTCGLTPKVGAYITQDDCSLRFFITAVGGGTITLEAQDEASVDDLNLASTILLSNPFSSDCQIENASDSILYLWGLTFQARGYGEDDVLYLKVMMPTINGLVVIKEYERTWVSNIHKIGLVETPDKAPGEIPAGLYMRVSYYTFKTDSTIIHCNYDYILTVKNV